MLIQTRMHNACVSDRRMLSLNDLRKLKGQCADVKVDPSHQWDLVYTPTVSVNNKNLVLLSL